MRTLTYDAGIAISQVISIIMERDKSRLVEQHHPAIDYSTEFLLGHTNGPVSQSGVLNVVHSQRYSPFSCNMGSLAQKCSTSILSYNFDSVTCLLRPLYESNSEFDSFHNRGNS